MTPDSMAFLNKKNARKIKALFDLIDADGSGQISSQDAHALTADLDDHWEPPKRTQQNSQEIKGSPHLKKDNSPENERMFHENQWLEDVCPIEMINHSLGDMLVFGGVAYSKSSLDRGIQYHVCSGVFCCSSCCVVPQFSLVYDCQLYVQEWYQMFSR